MLKRNYGKNPIPPDEGQKRRTHLDFDRILSDKKFLGKPRLVQTLEEPRQRGGIYDACLCPGVGQNANLTDPYLANVIGKIFLFAYMGLHFLSKCNLGAEIKKTFEHRDELICETIIANVQPPSIMLNRKKEKEIAFYIIRDQALESAYVKQFIEDQADKESLPLEGKAHVKSAVFNWDSAIVGWYDVEKHFFVFIDYDAFKETTETFGIKHIPLEREELRASSREERLEKKKQEQLANAQDIPNAATPPHRESVRPLKNVEANNPFPRPRR